MVTLALAVPALLAAVPAVARGSLRGRLLALGLLVYFFYQYLEYAVFWAFGPLFPLFVAMIINVWLLTGKLETVPLVIFGGAAVAGAGLGLRMKNSVLNNQ